MAVHGHAGDRRRTVLLDERRKRILGWFLIFLFACVYCRRLIHPDLAHASSFGYDATAHIALNHAYCESFMWGETHTDRYFWPIGVDLALTYDQPFLNLVSCVAAPLGAVAQYNLMAFLQVLLLLAVSYLVALRFLHLFWMRMAFVLMYSFCYFYQIKIMGQLNLLSTIWGAGLCFLLFYDLDVRNRSRVVLAFFLFGLTLASAWQNVANLGFLSLGLVARAVFRSRRQCSVWNLAGTAALALTVLAATCFPFFFPIGRAYRNAGLKADMLANYLLHADLLSFLVPPDWTRLGRFVIEKIGYDKIPAEIGLSERVMTVDPLVWLVLVVAGVAWTLGRRSIRADGLGKVLLIVGSAYFVLAMGPAVAVGNQVLFRTHYYDWLAKIPPLSMTRNPARLGIVTVFCFTILACVLMEGWLGRLKPYWRNSLSALVLVYSFWSAGFADFNARMPVAEFGSIIPMNAMNFIREKSALDAKVLHLPLQRVSDQGQDLMQIFHGRKLIAGYVSYTLITPSTFKFIDQHPYLGMLSCESMPLTLGEYTRKLSDLDRLVDSLLQYNIRFIVVDNFFPERPECEKFAVWHNIWFRPSNHFRSIGATDFYTVYEIVP